MKVTKICIILLISMFLFVPVIFAAESSVTIEGTSEAKVGETKTLSVKINSDTLIGVVSGKIQKDANISTITITKKNGWDLNYNPANGVFNVVKAECAKNEEIITIEYVVGNSEGTGTITISDLKVTDINYDEKSIGSISKSITIKKEQSNPTQDPPASQNPPTTQEPTTKTLSKIEITKAPTKTSYTVGQKFDKSGMVVKATYSDGTSKEVTSYTYSPSTELKEENKKITISYTENGVTKTVEQSISVTKVANNGGINSSGSTSGNSSQDATVSTSKIPNTGTTTAVTISIIALLISAVVFYKKYSVLKNI